eukprot:m.203660 g.203660  ORF g.203660 m.203660 type:complete len:74 (+) comp26009_c0_seq7:42-263(+)
MQTANATRLKTSPWTYLSFCQATLRVHEVPDGEDKVVGLTPAAFENTEAPKGNFVSFEVQLANDAPHLKGCVW